MQEIEKELIGLVLNEDRYLNVAEKLRPFHFADPFCKKVYQAIQSVSSESRSFTLPFIAKNIDHDFDVISQLKVMQLNADPQGNEEDYADTLIDEYYRRGIQDFKEELEKITNDHNLNGDQLVEEAVSKLLGKFEDQAIDEVYSPRSLTDQVLSPITPSQKGFKTSLSFFDDLLGPLLPGQVIVVGGATSSGKSSLAQCLSWNASSNGVPTYLVTNEMTARETMLRIMSQVSQVSLNKVSHENRRTADESTSLMNAKKSIDSWPLYIDSNEKAKVSTIRVRVQKAIQKYKIRFVVIDHLHDMRADNPRDTEHQQITQMISDIKAMAKSLNVTVLVVAHLNRDAMQRHIKKVNEIQRPNMSHLHGSSSIEKYADAVLFVHRPDYWISRMKAPEGESAENQYYAAKNKWAGKAEIIKHKQRNGQGFGLATVNFEETTTRFYMEELL